MVEETNILIIIKKKTMKTRHILTAMVLPAFLAACTADDLVENNSVNLGDRAELAPIAFTVGSDADTRFVFDETGYGNWKWEAAKDAFSAFLVESNGTPENKLYTNYIYKSTDGSKYETTSTMVEGIYWFYAPAAESKNTRDLLPFKLKTSQSADYYKSDDAKVFFTALYKLTKDDNPQGIKLDMMNYYSRAVFPLTNKTDGAVKVRQIILKGSKDFKVSGAISMAALSGYMYGFTEDGEMVPSVNLDKDPNNDMTVTKFKEGLQVVELATAPDKGVIETSPALVLDLGEGVSIAKDATETFTMLVPRTDANISCDITIITDKGMIEVKSTDKSNYAKNVQFKHNGIMPMFGLQSDKSFKPYSMEKDRFTDIGDAYYVSTYDDMMALINTVNGDINAYNFGDWGVDAVMAKAIENSDAYVKFQQPIEIADAKNEIDLTKVEFAAGVTVAKGTKVNFKASKVEDRPNVVEGAFTIAEGAEATLTAGIFAKAEIANNGTLKVAEKAVMKKDTETTGITSTGVLTLEDNIEAILDVKGGSLNYTTAKTKAAEYPTYAVKDKLTIPENGDLADNINITVGANVTLNVDEDLETVTRKVGNVTYKTNIENNGTISVADTKALTANGNLKNNAKIEGTGTVVVNGTAVNGEDAVMNVATTTIGSNATLTNSGELSGTTVTNSGKIITASGSRTKVTAGDGTIDNTAEAYIDVTSATDQVVAYEVTEALNADAYAELENKFSTYKINKLIFKNKITADKALTVATAIKEVDFAANSGIDVKSGATLTFAGVAKATISANVKFNGFAGTETITFDKTVEVTVNKNCTLTISYVTLTNKTANETTFVSEKKAASDPATTVSGKVVNNGTVKGAAEAYAEGEGEDAGNGWWFGTTAGTGI